MYAPQLFTLTDQVALITGAGAGIVRTYDLNVFSLFHLAQLAVPEMEKVGGGAILAITSMSAENKNQRMAA